MSEKGSEEVISGIPGAPGKQGIVKYANGSIKNGIGDEENRFECFARWIASHADKEGILQRMKDKKSPEYMKKIEASVVFEQSKINELSGSGASSEAIQKSAKGSQTKEQEKTAEYRKQRILARIAKENESRSPRP